MKVLLITLVTDDGQHVKAHKVILASVSDVLRKMLEKFDGEPSSQSIFFLRGVKYQNLASLLDFIYKGEASVHFQMLGDFMSLAKDLNVSGLNENDIDEKIDVSKSTESVLSSSNDALSEILPGTETEDNSEYKSFATDVNADTSEEFSYTTEELESKPKTHTEKKKHKKRKLIEESNYERPFKTNSGEIRPVTFPLLQAVFKGVNWTPFLARETLKNYLRILGFNSISHNKPSFWPDSVTYMPPNCLSFEETNKVLGELMNYFGIDLKRYHTSEAESIEMEDDSFDTNTFRNFSNKVPFPLLPIKFGSPSWDWKCSRSVLSRFMCILGFRQGNGDMIYSEKKNKPLGWPSDIKFTKPKFLRKADADAVIQSILHEHFGIDIYKYHILEV